MIKLLITSVVVMAFVIGCKRLGLVNGDDTPADGMTAAGYNTKLIVGYAWPIILPFLRFIPVIGPPLQAIAANISWGTLATKKQKDAEKAQ